MESRLPLDEVKAAARWSQGLDHGRLAANTAANTGVSFGLPVLHYMQILIRKFLISAPKSVKLINYCI